METNLIYIGLGSNLGNREQYLELAMREISEFSRIKQKSSVHETEPIGYKKQGKYLNMVIEALTDLTPAELIIRLQEIEHKLGRTREIKNGPRTIDLDILFFGDKKVDQKHLKIPHPKVQQRAFVLNPLAEIAPNLIHPKFNKDIKTLKHELGQN